MTRVRFGTHQQSIHPSAYEHLLLHFPAYKNMPLIKLLLQKTLSLNCQSRESKDT